jgi:beta-fructofuranosidase
MCADGTYIGDVMPYYDSATSKFNVFYLKGIWNDATNKHHPWYGFQSSNFSSFTELSAGELLSSSSNGCSLDYSVGTGSMIKSGSTYYEFYSGHNPNYPSGCVTKAEGIMLATSTGLNQPFVKSTSFATLYPPTGLNFDENDNFRDPYVFYDSATAKYYMLVAARNDLNGTWRGVIIKYTSTNLTSWTYQGIVYDGGAINYFMMETPQITKIGSTYYLFFSDINTKKRLLPQINVG